MQGNWYDSASRLSVGDRLYLLDNKTVVVTETEVTLSQPVQETEQLSIDLRSNCQDAGVPSAVGAEQLSELPAMTPRFDENGGCENNIRQDLNGLRVYHRNVSNRSSSVSRLHQ